ncbi:MAG: hypothetical protein ACN4GZ_19250 [Acidimicrobiales bacterium]
MSGPFGGYDVDWSSGSEEPWEKQISSLLGSLPPVEPPPGFLENLASQGPRIDASFTLDAESMFSFPIMETDED